jgi:transposase
MIDPLLPGAEVKKHCHPRLDDRNVLNGILFVLCTGTPWRDLPTSLHDDLQSIQSLGQEKGIWLRMFETLAANSPQSLQLIDNPIIRAHQHAAGGKKGARTAPSAVLVEDGAPRPIPRSIRPAMPIRVVLSQGPSFRLSIAPVLTVQLEPSRDLIVDRGYDARARIELVSRRGHDLTSRPILTHLS